MAEHTPFDLVHKLDVEKVLKTDKGPDALLKSFKVEDFTTKGDNYACIVACVVVQYEKSGKACDMSQFGILASMPVREARFQRFE